MGRRLGPGPVFVYEGLAFARRWQPYAMRAGLVGLILVGMAVVSLEVNVRANPAGTVSFRALARFGRSMYENIVWIELTLVLLAAPAATAGAICLDRARGTLDHMLVTDLSDAEIVLGKLGVRLIPVLGLVACTLPVLALASLLGGIDPAAMFGLFLVVNGCALVGCSTAMVLSIYGRKTHEVLMMTYLVLIIWIIAPALPETVDFLVAGTVPVVGSTTLGDWVERSNPYILALSPYGSPDRFGAGTYLGFLAGCLAVATALTALAAARIRGITLSWAGRPAAGRRRSRLLRSFRLPRLPGPSLDGNPVAWREWHRSRPSLMMRIAWGLYSAIGLLSVILASSWKVGGPTGEGVALMCVFQVSVGLLLLSVGAATSLAEERARGSLDVLLSTPIPTRSILAGKWWGGYRRVLLVVIWPAVMLLCPAFDEGRWMPYLALLGLVLTYGAAITSLGLLLATWVGRVGRAVALCVAVYVVLGVGWPLLVLLLLGGVERADYAACLLMMGDPPFGVGVLSLTVSSTGILMVNGTTAEDQFGGAILWIGGYVAAALFLNWLTRRTFDRCLGRIPDAGLRPPSPPRRRSPLADVERLELVPSSSAEGP